MTQFLVLVDFDDNYGSSRVTGFVEAEDLESGIEKAKTAVNAVAGAKLVSVSSIVEEYRSE